MKEKTTQKKVPKKDIIKDLYSQKMVRPLQEQKVPNKILILFLILSTLAGFLAGFVHDIWFDEYTPVVLEDTKDPESEVIDLNFLLKKEDDSFTQVLSELKSQIVGIYDKRVADDILGSIYLEKDFLGSGMILTSDGWILTHSSVIGDTDYVIITDDKKVLEPISIVHDEFSGVVLIQVSATNLKPVKFADLDSLQPTKSLLVSRFSAQNHGSDIIKTSIQKSFYHDQSVADYFLLTTESIDHYLKLDKDFEEVYNGALVVNDQVEIVGLIFNSGRSELRLAIPAYYLESAVDNFLTNSSEIFRSSLGVTYVDLSETLGLDESITEGKLKGAVLLGNASEDILSVLIGSPAEEAGLEAGDIILKVNDEEIDERNSLTKLVQEYTPGQELTLLILRSGEEIEIKVVLGEL
ncbi:PDZ domain-containing protein [bacterium]|jgi:S1-C subfamily serine protease|nr:PDZ domain-containing protein [bacterium]MBT4122087.1 PDZ domain-containing protein [bacterium]MBT4495576.1 PDZ domain-containing protein [bacterium]MBT4764234.1 PDZ domain-containing protein [bacterium]MBT5401606.1 PDZ domain-containing protein [bacterium]